MLMSRKLGLTLLLLVACLGSAPLGSMEQDQARASAYPSLSRAPSAVQSLPRLRLDPVWTEPCQHAPPGTDPPFLPPLAAATALGVAAPPASVYRVHTGPAPGTLPPRLCERLPYDANAPPVLA